MPGEKQPIVVWAISTNRLTSGSVCILPKLIGTSMYPRDTIIG